MDEIHKCSLVLQIYSKNHRREEKPRSGKQINALELWFAPVCRYYRLTTVQVHLTSQRTQFYIKGFKRASSGGNSNSSNLMMSDSWRQRVPVLVDLCYSISPSSPGSICWSADMKIDNRLCPRTIETTMSSSFQFHLKTHVTHTKETVT